MIVRLLKFGHLAKLKLLIVLIIKVPLKKKVKSSSGSQLLGLYAAEFPFAQVPSWRVRLLQLSCSVLHSVLRWIAQPGTSLDCTTWHFIELHNLALYWIAQPGTLLDCTTWHFIGLHNLELHWIAQPGPWY